MYGYSLFGLRVLATQPLPGVAALGNSGAPDVEVQVGTLPPWLEHHASTSQEFLYVSPYQDEAGHPLLTVAELDGGGFFWLRYGDGIEFVVDRPGTEIWTSWPEPWTLDDVATYLLGPVLAFTLRLRGITCLHASALAAGDRAIALVGPAGVGKSTLAATFAKRGHPVISDDVVALNRQDGRFFVQPGAPCIRLWPESVLALYGSIEALPRLTPTWEKRLLDLTQNGCRFQHQPLPLVAIYLLAERSSDAGMPRVEGLSSAAGLMALVANTHANHLLDKTMRAQEFECLGLLVGSVPIRRVIPHEDPALLSRLGDVILDDAQGLPTPSAIEAGHG
jgi:hypothetical protein